MDQVQEGPLRWSGLEQLSGVGWGLSSLEKGWLWRDLRAAPYTYGKDHQEVQATFFTVVHMRQQILTETKHVQTASKENLFSLTTIKYWKRLPREVVKCPFLEGFKTQMEKALSNFI